MTDPLFERTLVLVWHHDEDGAIGVIVNRPLEHLLPDVVEVDSGLDLHAYDDEHVSWGGPVETRTGTVVTTARVEGAEGWNLGPLGVTRSKEVLDLLLQHKEPLLLCLGYAGWGPGQLDQEILGGSWLLTELSASLIFETPFDERYERALATLGLRPQDVWMTPIDE